MPTFIEFTRVPDKQRVFLAAEYVVAILPDKVFEDAPSCQVYFVNHEAFIHIQGSADAVARAITAVAKKE